MATQVTIRETRTVIFVNGVQTFRLVVQCTDRGDLPDTNLFLKQIVDTQDPQQDVFTRIVELADLNVLNTDVDEPGYKPDRSAAVAAGDTFWRSDTFTKDYTDIEVANQAVAAVSDRLNTLVTDFTTYDASFKTAPTEDKYFPSADPTTVQELKDAYDTALATYRSAQSTATTAQTDLTNAENDLSGAEASLNEWSAFGDAMQALIDSNNAVAGSFSVFASTYSKAFIACVDKFTEDYTSYFPRYQQQVLELQLDAAPYDDFTDADVGKTVSDTGNVNQGTLIAYDNANRTILLTPAEPREDNQFDAVPTDIFVADHAGFWTMSTAATVVVEAGTGPNLQELISCRERFAGYRLTAETDVSNANVGNSAAQAIKSDVDTQVTDKTSDVATAQTAVTAAQTNVNKALGDLQTAYDNLEEAYDAVKTVCPAWSPAEAFPPLPETV